MTSRTLTILYFGDVFGDPGRTGLRRILPDLLQEFKPDVVFANCENAARGRGVSPRLVKELTDSGVDFMTSGNHIFAVGEIYPYLNSPECRVLRPYNLSRNAPGKGVAVVEARNGTRVGLINIMGRVFMEPGVNLPFDAVDQAILELQGEADCLVLDMHAETTSEKRAMAWHVDGRVHLTVGTHTHVQTADEEVMPGGMAYITDLGMCGPYDSVIGMDKNIILKRFRTALPQKFEIGEGDVRVCGIVCRIDLDAKKAISIERIQKRIK